MKLQTLVRKLVTAVACIILILLTVGMLFIFTPANRLPKGAIVTNGYDCARIGTSILERGGNAAEAAIAALFCEGVSMPQSMGLGGGFLLTIYNKTTGEVWSLNARETAPGASTANMFNGNSTLSQRGGTAVGVPGELLGYWYLYQKFGGNLPWKDLVEPTINLCKTGVYVTSFLAGIYKSRKELLYADPVLRDIYINPLTNDTYLEGEYVKRPRLAKTLEVIAEEGGTALHNGSLTEAFVQDIKTHGGIITVEDMNNYRPEWQTSVQATLLGNHTLYTSPLPGTGMVLAFILNILSDFIDTTKPFTNITTQQRIVESFKFGYGMRTLLGDANFLNNSDELVSQLLSKEYAESIRKRIFDYQTFQDPAYYGANTTLVQDHGTAHVSILAPNGDAVSVTSTINFLFGAGFASNSTGIILNDEMDDFSSPNLTNGFDLPPSPANFIEPGKRPLSSMVPSIIVDKNGDVEMVTGAAGGTKITTSVALAIMKHLWYGMDLQTAVNDKRLHHQLFPMQISFETAYATEDTEIVELLSLIGHRYNITDDDGFAAMTCISRKNGNNNVMTGVYDKRRAGSVKYVR
ncbi:hypothetical protein NQ315_001633 [Exocentrus adspersus]|uniref:Uncharacterized protein n=1 Tax=Exocentrus adspersus TaxID=1586481 RepID=A0AAV8WBM5_9CUCU|nr:hypothetical protein NQ315_001633 [Exocentrus adspersus]